MPFQVKMPDSLIPSLMAEMKTANQATSFDCATTYDLAFILADGIQKTVELDTSCSFVRCRESGYQQDYILSKKLIAALKDFLREEHPEFREAYE